MKSSFLYVILAINIALATTASAKTAPLAAPTQGCCSSGGAVRTRHATEFDRVAAFAGIHPSTAALADERVEPLFKSYFKIQKALAADTLEGVAKNAGQIQRLAGQSRAVEMPTGLATAAEAEAKAKDLKSARHAFQKLSRLLIQYQQKHPQGGPASFVIYCPMAKASWLQPTKAVNNPYLGKSMANCGIVKN